MASFAQRRLRALALVAMAFVLAILTLAVDARARVASARDERESNVVLARATGLSELALSTSSTWLRHPALAAPSAGAADAPLGLDVDPAGAVIPRPSRERTLTLHREAP